MLETVIKILCTIVYVLLDYYIIRYYLEYKDKLSKKNIFLLILFIVLELILYDKRFRIYKVLLKLIIGLIINEMMFNKDKSKTLSAYLIFTIELMLSDLFASIILMFIFDKVAIRQDALAMITSNAIVYIICFLLFDIDILKSKIKKLISLDISKIISLLMISVTLGINVLSVISKIYKLDYKYMININSVILMFMLAIFYIIFYIDYNDLKYNYDNLLELASSKDEITEINGLARHERKNILILIKGYIETGEYDKAIYQIDELMQLNKENEKKDLTGLNNLPKGGIQKLFYYMLLEALNNKIKVNIDISKTVRKPLSKLTNKKEILLCRIIGIYLKNAIDACKLSRKKVLTLEIYSLEKGYIDMVISNTFKKSSVNLSLIGKKGYTTKGKGHGKGTYYAEKIIKKNKFLSHKTKVVDSYYVEHVRIKY